MPQNTFSEINMHELYTIINTNIQAFYYEYMSIVIEKSMCTYILTPLCIVQALPINLVQLFCNLTLCKNSWDLTGIYVTTWVRPPFCECPGQNSSIHIW